ncbi:MAG TPA: glycosyltransferase family 87 protein [Bryobacteraceae bacterium]|nr:glycosyltransferase family 87 protein [Bryobacteraceae bacterium]
MARSLLGAPPGVPEIRLACWTALSVTATLVALSLVSAARGRQFLGHLPGGDFVAFYTAGKILNEYPPASLYDQQLQYRLHHALLPEMPPELFSPYFNTPFLAWLFRPLARLPFLWSYGVWTAISLALYLGGLALLWPRDKAFGEVSRIAFLACCSFPPFAIECLAGGQVSAIGFFAFALSTRWQRSARSFAAGAALALCLYKPPLLLVVVPMLAIGRRWRVLAGFSAGACVVGALSLVAVGYGGCVAYLEALRLRAGLATLNPSPLSVFKCVDIQSFFRLLFGGYSHWSAAAALILGGTGFAILAWRWARSTPGTQADGLLWAATVAWTLVVNVSIPIYDTVLIVIGALVMAGVVYPPRPEQAESGRLKFLWWMLALYLAAIITQPLAKFAGIQILTPVLVGIGALALTLSRRAEGSAHV